VAYFFCDKTVSSDGVRLMTMSLKILWRVIILFDLVTIAFPAQAESECRSGYTGIGGPAYMGIGGPCYTGVGGGGYNGLGGPAYDGVGGPCYSGIGGPAYDGIGGPAYDGVGGPAYSGIGGDPGPFVCMCKIINKPGSH
jgi:hypothetical protein